MPLQRLAIVVAVALLASGCSKGAPKGARPSSPAVTTSSASAAPDDEGSEDPRARPDDREPTGRPAPEPPPPGRAPQHTPPAAGTYRYTQSGETKLGTLSYEPDPEGTLRIERARVEGRGQAQRQVRKMSQRNEVEYVYLFTREAVLLTYTAQAGVECAPEPALIAVELPLKVDTTWSSTGTCGDVSVTLQGKVMLEEPQEVGGTDVDTFKINLATEIRSTTFTQSSGVSAWVSPAHRLIVRSEEASHGTFNGATFTSRLTSHLVSLRPA